MELKGDVDAWEPGEYKTIAGTSVSAAYFTNAKLQVMINRVIRYLIAYDFVLSFAFGLLSPIFAVYFAKY